jgi:hypothetical protein
MGETDLLLSFDMTATVYENISGIYRRTDKQQEGLISLHLILLK